VSLAAMTRERRPMDDRVGSSGMQWEVAEAPLYYGFVRKSLIACAS
jgi:hypothetical protein